jgi:hypothetical protein
MSDYSRSHQVPAASETGILIRAFHKDASGEDVQFFEGPWVDNPSFPYPPVPAYTDYAEQVSPDVPGPRTEWKDFEHYKMFVPPLPLSSPVLAPTDIYTIGFDNSDHLYHILVHPDAMWAARTFGLSDDNPFEGLPPFRSGTDVKGFVPLPTNFDELVNGAYAHMVPSMKSELSLVNSIIELRDFESLPRTLEAVKSFAFIGLKSLKSFTGKAFRSLFKKSSRVGSDAYLQLEFNILPTISDVLGINRALQNLEKRLNALVSSGARVRRRHFDYVWDEYQPYIEQDSDNSVGYLPNPTAPITLKRTVIHDPSKFHAEIEYNLNFTQYQLEHARVLALLDRLGVNINPQIIWNAIPWSFLVDWVLGVSQWLKQFKVSNMEPQINIRRFLASVKRKRVVSFSVSTGNNGHAWVHYSSGVPGRTYIESAYRRQNVGLTLSPLLANGLTPKEVSLGAALVLAKRRRHRR